MRSLVDTVAERVDWLLDAIPYYDREDHKWHRYGDWGCRWRVYMRVYEWMERH